MRPRSCEDEHVRQISVSLRLNASLLRVDASLPSRFVNQPDPLGPNKRLGSGERAFYRF